MLDFIKKNYEFVLAFLFALVILRVLSFAWHYFNLPNIEMFITYLQGLFLIYGLYVVFVSAFIESLFLIGNYFPGTIILAFSITNIGNSKIALYEMPVIMTVGMILGYSINYLLGKYAGTYVINKFKLQKDVEDFKVKIEKEGFGSIFFIYILPGFGSIISVSAGAIKFNFLKFLQYISIAVIFWNTLWVILGHIFGEALLSFIKSGYFGYAILFIFFFYFIFSGKYKQFYNK